MATDLYALAEQVEDEAGFLRFLAALAADWEEDRRRQPAETVRPQPAGLGERQHRWLPRCRRDLGRGLPRRPAGLFQAGECLAARGAADAGGQVL
ncbi:TPA: hypothetical protein SL824_005934 [Pseudomonas aeruginosa]|uniref:hypothetical protein n=1 Tax=Pseudomonas aeruginosa TaxID=287 RepID=UPI00163BDE24|nr:hypothetical protein [Pseudomonas aeruginosa]MCS7786233.1 hypothetical protein [Pseudomonas aeruginosa]HEJ4886074.1 hypothetical protein [Pseudomonas aeruginosa]HEJ5487957.1 hypothetical protein [Pseudomonas aeruginosa]HEJ6048571.1 hypothetical protein [Pseudomonas aeruginosa]